MPRESSAKEIFSTHDAARICRVTPMTVIRWIEEGKIPAFKTVGGHRRILRDDLECFCRSHGIPFDPEGSLDRGRVLVVDADPAVRELVTEAVRGVGAGLSIEVAGNAFDAGWLVAQFRPNLVFFDQRMPGTDAYEICSRLSGGRGGGGPAVAVMSAAPGPDTERAFKSRGAAFCLGKPLTAAAVDRIVRSVFGLPDARPVSVAPRVVLVIDDDAGFLRAIQRDLAARAPGCRVLVSDSLLDGLLAIGTERPDLILLDIGLADPDPEGVVRRIRSRLPDDRVLLALVDGGRSELSGAVLRAGAHEVLERPIDAERVIAHLAGGARAASSRRRGGRRGR